MKHHVSHTAFFFPLISLLFIVLFLCAYSLFQTADSTPFTAIITTPPGEIAYETLTAPTQVTAPPRDMVELTAQLCGIEAPCAARYATETAVTRQAAGYAYTVRK